MQPNDLLELPMAQRMVIQYRPTAEARELCLYYGAREISFDDPDMFAFGETLGRQTRFVAQDAIQWGSGYAWTRVSPLLDELLSAGVLRRATGEQEAAFIGADRERASPLPPAHCERPRSWREAETITYELTGRSVEPGYLEIFVPIFRVAHMTLDADGRQVGEANVFPRPMRTDMPTQWLACIYPGTRFMAEAPMNATALKAMRTHWPQMMTALLHVRAAYLRRCPDAARGWTVGHIERLSTAVLALVSLSAVRWGEDADEEPLHPALSSLFRVTDGLRMVMHQMMFVPVGEPTLHPDAPMSAAAIYDYAERNYSFHSDSGVCAGPKIMVQEFLSVLLDGARAETYSVVVPEPAVARAISEVDNGLDYALLGLQTYAITFSLWPQMTRAYEQIADICAQAVAADASGFAPLASRMRLHRENLRSSPYLAREKWRADRDHVYADMYRACGRALRQDEACGSDLPELLAPRREAADLVAAGNISEFLRSNFMRGMKDHTFVEQIVDAVMDFARRTRAIVRAATAQQDRINRLLHRPRPTRPLTAADLNVHNLLQGDEGRTIPYLLDELSDALDLRIHIDATSIVVLKNDQKSSRNSTGYCPAEGSAAAQIGGIA